MGAQLSLANCYSLLQLLFDLSILKFVRRRHLHLTVTKTKFRNSKKFLLSSMSNLPSKQWAILWVYRVTLKKCTLHTVYNTLLTITLKSISNEAGVAYTTVIDASSVYVAHVTYIGYKSERNQIIKNYSTFITPTCGLAFDHTLPISLKLDLIAGYMWTIRPYPSSMYTATSPIKL